MNAFRKIGWCVAMVLFSAVVAGAAVAGPVSVASPQDYPVYDDALDVTVGGQRTYYSGELMYVDWSTDHPVGNSAGFTAYSVVPSDPVPPALSARKSVQSTQWFEVMIAVRDPASNDILYTLDYQNCVFTGLAYIGGHSHPTFDCPPQ
jgi:hypothetical protein